jgi:hypothetical protein
MGRTEEGSVTNGGLRVNAEDAGERLLLRK